MALSSSLRMNFLLWCCSHGSAMVQVSQSTIPNDHTSAAAPYRMPSCDPVITSGAIQSGVLKVHRASAEGSDRKRAKVRHATLRRSRFEGEAI